MDEFNVNAECDICKQKKLCTEIILINKQKQQKVEFWCKDCIDEIEKEEAKKQEEAMQEVYEDIIRSSH